MTHPTERQTIALLRRREAVLAGRKYADAVKRGDTRAQHKLHREWVILKARAIEAEAKL
jgi:hypothetical protein